MQRNQLSVRSFLLFESIIHLEEHEEIKLVLTLSSLSMKILICCFSSTDSDVSSFNPGIVGDFRPSTAICLELFGLKLPYCFKASRENVS